MKRIVFGSIALIALGMSAPAVAADIPVKAKAPPPVLVYDWSGAYIGFNAGGMWTDINRHFIAPPGLGDFTTSNDGDFIYGFHAGAQWQWGQWVLGFEAALTGCREECRSTTGALPVPLFFPNTAGEHKLTNLFTVGPRLGFAWDRWMIFGTGGYASATLNGSYCSTVTGLCGPAVTFENGQSRNDGWYAGGGFEYMAHKGPLVDVVLGVEYQHWDVSGERAFCLTPACNSVTDYNLDAKGDLVRARLTIKTQGYGWWGKM